MRGFKPLLLSLVSIFCVDMKRMNSAGNATKSEVRPPNYFLGLGLLAATFAESSPPQSEPARRSLKLGRSFPEVEAYKAMASDRLRNLTQTKKNVTQTPGKNRLQSPGAKKVYDAKKAQAQLAQAQAKSDAALTSYSVASNSLDNTRTKMDEASAKLALARMAVTDAAAQNDAKVKAEAFVNGLKANTEMGKARAAYELDLFKVKAARTDWDKAKARQDLKQMRIAKVEAEARLGAESPRAEGDHNQ